MGFWEVEFVDFCVAAEGTSNERQLSFQKIVFCQSFVEFAEYILSPFVCVKCPPNKMMGYATLTIVTHWGKTP
jgi:hypothetical protein